MPPSSVSSTPALITFPFFVIFMAFPYLFGMYFSHYNLDTMQEILGPWLYSSQTKKRIFSVPTNDMESCYQRLLMEMHNGRHAKRQDRPFDGVSIVVHRNGEATACGETASADILAELRKTLDAMHECPTDFGSKYQVESLLTRMVHSSVSSLCTSMEDTRSPEEGFYGYCDMGENRTPLLLDHDELVPIQHVVNGRSTTYLPCHFHTREGVRVTSLPFLAYLARHARIPNKECKANDKSCTVNERQRELHLYAVPAGRVFMFAPSYVGETIQLPHVKGADPSKPIFLEVLSLSPRVFNLVNFFSKSESEDLVKRALKETRESHRIKRSSTGATGYNINQRRTSESGFDTGGKTAMILKRRCLDVLGFDRYIESHTDGLQILRYNMTTAYAPHMDWIEGNDQLEHNYDSAGKGGNRYATILLYMSDLGEKDGGETVFTEAWPVPIGQVEEDRVDQETALLQLRESGESNLLKKDSWEEKMVASCRARLAIRPSSGRAVLFFSQLPNGQQDPASLHGACPVLSGQKYAANLWVWNTPRDGFEGNPKNPKFQRT